MGLSGDCFFSLGDVTCHTSVSRDAMCVHVGMFVRAAFTTTMADLFRSQEMVFLEAIVPEETAHSFVHQLAVLGVSEIVDVRCLQ